MRRPVPRAGHTDTVRALALSDDGAVLFSGSWDSSIRAWRASDGLYLYTLEGHTGAVLALMQSLNGEVSYLIAPRPRCCLRHTAAWKGSSLHLAPPARAFSLQEVLRARACACRFSTLRARTAQ